MALLSATGGLSAKAVIVSRNQRKAVDWSTYRVNQIDSVGIKTVVVWVVTSDLGIPKYVLPRVRDDHVIQDDLQRQLITDS